MYPNKQLTDSEGLMKDMNTTLHHVKMLAITVNDRIITNSNKLQIVIIEKRDNEFTPIYVETRVPGEKPRLFVLLLFSNE